MIKFINCDQVLIIETISSGGVMMSSWEAGGLQHGET